VVSWQARAMKRGGFALVSAKESLGGREPSAHDVPGLRATFERLAKRQRLPSDVVHTIVDMDGVSGEQVTTSESTNERIVLWLHGGAFIMCSPRTHRGIAATMARRSRATVYVPEYRLAPEHPYPDAFDDVMAAWNFLSFAHDPSSIVVAGDSAGGGLAMQLAVALRDAGRPMPGALVLLSPWVDLSGSGPTMWERNKRDPWLSAEHLHLAAEAYAGDLPVTDALVSPLFAQMHGMPAMLVHVGTDEILHDDGVRLVAKARAAGCDASVGIWEGMFHVFQAFPVPEARRAWREIGGFMRRAVPGDVPSSPPPPHPHGAADSGR
jgi:monoterpene epsilon-lactone hydrolase